MKPTNSFHNRNDKQKVREMQTAAAIKRLIIPDVSCPDCRGKSHCMEDPKRGMTVCTQCGLVLEKQVISEQSEWRTFADSDKSGPDPNRVGAAEHYLLNDIGDLSTVIGAKDSSKLSNLQRSTGSANLNDKLRKGIRDITNYGQRLNLTKDVQNCSGELFKELTTKKEMKGKNGLCMVAVCIYMAAKQCKCDRPLSELCQMLNVGPKSVRKIHTEVCKLRAKGELNIPQLTRGHGLKQRSTEEIFAMRYSNDLKLDIETKKTLKKVMRQIVADGCLAGKKPNTIAAAGIYLTCQVSKNENQRRSYKEIAVVAKISEHTISNSFRQHLHSKRKELVPPGFADILRLENLPRK